ncbi:MAG TPA: hypothetical protein VHM88_14480, partial [Candidatus Acidoferrales bacterium]|nr:hypothetical protein [Candidatus Acidoferrales bacterium]
AGRTVVYVAGNGVVVGAVAPAASGAEAGSHLLPILPIGGSRIAVLLGAIEWLSPASGRPPVRLDWELAGMASDAAPRRQPEPYQASDIEAIGVALLERLHAAASQLHRKIDLKPDEPLLELLLVNYVEDYGPEVWLLKYRIAQDAWRGDYWRTRVLRPSYTQLYPPEKGHPRTLIEVHYPPEEPGPAVLDLLTHDDPQMARLRAADAPIARAIERLVRGESNKGSADDAAAFLRAALPALYGADAKLALGVLREHSGFEWLVEPPELPQPAKEGKPREPGAPTLRKKP